MQLNDLSKLAADQDEGHAFELLDPIRGGDTGIKITMVGPDSERARKARFDMEREITRLSRRKGGMGPEVRERLMDDFLFALTLGWEITEDDQPVAFTRDAFLRLLRAGTWVRAQVDTFAADRSPYFEAD